MRGLSQNIHLRRYLLASLCAVRAGRLRGRSSMPCNWAFCDSPIKQGLSVVGALCGLLCLCSPAQAEWVSYGYRKIWVEQVLFHDFGLKVYYTGNSELIFRDETTDEILFVVPLDFGEGLEGFQTFMDPSGLETVLFAVSSPGQVRFFRIDNGQEVFVQVTEAGEFRVLDTRPDFPGRSVAVIRSWYAAQSRIKEQQVVRVTSPRQWEQLWIAHRGEGSPAPRINFKQDMVVAVFFGTDVNSDGCEVLAVREDAQRLVLYLRQKKFRASGGIRPASPVGFFVLPLNERAILVKEKVFVSAGQPYHWQALAELPRQ